MMANLKEILTEVVLKDGKSVLDSNGAEVSIDQITGQDRVVAFYFSGRWCGPCLQFTPMLADWYEKLKPEGFEIIYVNQDENNESYEKYYKTMPWLTVGYDSELRSMLRKKYNPGSKVPRLVLVNGETGEVITEDGRRKVMDELDEHSLPWIKGAKIGQ